LAWVVVYGGKLTSYRSYAARILNRIGKRIGAPAQPRRLDTATSPLFGAVPPTGTERGTPPSTAQEQTWRKRYGTRWHELARRVREQPALSEVLVPGHGFTRADLDYLLDVEQAYWLEDVALRRTKLAYDMTAAEAGRVRDALGEAVRRRGWLAEE
jgi:glycerol-3-phosphate dehydrogenase